MNFPLLIPQPHLLTDDELIAIANQNEGWQFETTANKELVIMPPTGGNSGRRNLDITTQLGIWVRANRALGIGFDSSTEFKLPNGARRSPDASWVRRDRWEALTSDEREGFPPLCPDFVVELRSPSDRLPPLQDKMQEYMANGAVLGWLIDPKTKQVEIYRAGQEKEVLESNTILSGESVLPGFTLDLTEILD